MKLKLVENILNEASDNNIQDWDMAYRQATPGQAQQNIINSWLKDYEARKHITLTIIEKV